MMKEKRQKNLVHLAIVLFLFCFLAGCSRQDEENVVLQEKKQEGLQVGMSFDSFVIERWLRDRDQFELTAKNLGAEVNVQVANGDAKEQISQIRYFIRKNVDVIVVIAVDGEQLSDVVAEAKEAGIRVISYDRLVMDADTDLYISLSLIHI